MEAQGIINPLVGKKNPILRGYAAFNNRDWSTLEELLCDEVLWHRVDDHDDAHPIRGRAAVIDHLKELRETTEAEFLGMVVHDDTVITLDFSHVNPPTGNHACADRVVFDGDCISEVWHCESGTHP